MSIIQKAASKFLNIATHPHYHSWAYHRNRCNVCHRHTLFLCDYAADRWIRRCAWCRSTPKYRAILLVLEQALGRPLSSLMEAGGHVYELSTTSPIFRRYQGNPNFVGSGYFSDRPFGVELRPRVWNQDLQRLSYPSESFDAVISSETMEHVRKPWIGFSEIYRVLKRGGVHVFTIPYRDDRLTISRVDTSGPENIYTLPKVYHRDPYRVEDSLVYTDYGSDLPALLEPIGFQTTIQRVIEPDLDIQDDLRPVIVFVSVKP